MPAQALPQIGKYEVESVLGRGAMGVVYRAVDPRLGRRVAIKTMSAAGPRDTEFRLRFLREARSVARLQHPNIVTVHELLEEEGAAYIVMELLEGAPLSVLLRKGRPLRLGEKLSILEQIANGLQLAHENAVVHRDLKPSNVFLSRGGVVKVLDFGVAKVGEGDLTRAGTVFGTVEYMAPEQVRGESVDPQADIFSWGVVGYELLTRRNPFRAETLGASVFKILSDHPESLAAQVEGLPPGIERVVFRALAKNKHERFASMAEAAAALRDAAREAGVEIAPPVLAEEEVEKAKPIEGASLHAAESQPLDQWSNVAAAAGQLEEIYRAGIEAFQKSDFAGCVDHMSRVLDDVPMHSMALHYLAQSEEKIRQQKLDPAVHQELLSVLTAMRTAHRNGDSKRVIETSQKLLALDPESLEARWYRRSAESRMTAPSRSVAHRSPAMRSTAFEARFPRPKSTAGDARPTLVIPALPAERSATGSFGIWLVAGAGMLFLAAVALIWGLGGKPVPRAEGSVQGAPGPRSPVRSSPFEQEDEVVLYVPRPGDAAPPVVTTVVPREVHPGEETKVGLFGKNFAAGAQVGPADDSGEVEVRSVSVVSGGLIEATLHVVAPPTDGDVSLVVVNPDGARSAVLKLAVGSP